MKVRPWAEFVSDLPDDGVEDDTGFVLYPGRGVAEAIGEHLNKAGYRVSPPEHRWERGWDFEFWASERRFWCQVSDLDEYFLLVCRDMGRTLTDNLLQTSFVAALFIAQRLQLRSSVRVQNLHFNEGCAFLDRRLRRGIVPLPDNPDTSVVSSRFQSDRRWNGDRFIFLNRG